MGLSFAAPLAGCDAISSAITGVYTPFQSTHPLRGATTIARKLLMAFLFQSTRPLRGATEELKNISTATNISIHVPLAGRDTLPRLIRFEQVRISIHAPLAGRDYTSPRRAMLFRAHFNPRAPCGARQGGCQVEQHAGRISIHAPLAGRDRHFLHPAQLPSISIHAPLAGCDQQTTPSRPADSGFQSTHPLRGATVMLEISPAVRSYFNPRTPCGVRRRCRRGRWRLVHFNPRTPCGVRLRRPPARFTRFEISIHAPLAGCDTSLLLHIFWCMVISIHAPLAGCDRESRRVESA